nr:aldehyde dehydrogenase [Candidatus Woesebacteria bacterium]
VVKVIPELKGKIEVFAVRVPVPVGSASDLAVVLNREVTPDEVNAAYKAASVGAMRGVVDYAEDLLVSSDIIGNNHSTVFDPRYTKVTAGTMVKVFGWYDNEWGYSCRVVDLVEKVARYL